MYNEGGNGGNQDYPDANLGIHYPLSFPSGRIGNCHKMNVLVYVPTLNQTTIIDDVLIPVPHESSHSESDSNEDFMEEDTDEELTERESNCAYWLQRPLMDAIYGVVRKGTILKRRKRTKTVANSHMQNENEIKGGLDEPFAEWEITNERCAIKQMEWSNIRYQRGISKEDPIAEIEAMQFLSNCLLPNDDTCSNEANVDVDPEVIRRCMHQYNVLLPLCALSDERYLYSVMPYCNGGEFYELLNERVTERGRLSESEARFWILQILTGIQTLQSVGICHRDLSFENLLVHDNSCLIMDFGMCCGIPYTQIAKDTINYNPKKSRGDRLLIMPAGAMGKLDYMSPEIAQSDKPFDGHAVDLWAVAIMLFTMVTGARPWEHPTRADYSFRYMTGGQMRQVLSGWNMGLTPAVMDLLEKMLFYDPLDRLSLDQIFQHPWMQGEVQRPSERENWAVNN